MLKSKSFLALNFGAGSLKLAEFDQSDEGGLRLRQFDVRPLGLAGAQDAARERVITKALQDALAEGGYPTRTGNACAPGFQVFSKFVKLPPVDTSKVTQIIQYEAQQNVPFPLEDVVWDYQILGTTPSGELEVLLVAIKSDIVETLFRVADGSGLRLGVVDVSQAALCNAFRYNYGDLEGCIMLLDIGAKTSNVLFFENGKMFARGINIGANSITQDFAAETRMPFVEADKFKIADGFVSLGGAYEDPENPKQAAISKIARQVMTRLHIQVNQTIQFYRGQQGGGAPEQLFLAGGASIMPYTAQFFAEKLSLPVEYFNPFRNVEIDPELDLDSLASVAHGFGEVVGLGLRSISQCPVELNLIPKSSLQKQQMAQKRPYFIATVVSLILVVLAFGLFFNRTTKVIEEKLAEIEAEVSPLEGKHRQLKSAESSFEDAKKEVDQLADWISERFLWTDVFLELQRVFQTTESLAQNEIGVDVGVWVDSLQPILPDLDEAYVPMQNNRMMMNPYMMMMDPMMMMRYGGGGGMGMMPGMGMGMGNPYGMGGGMGMGMGMGMGSPPPPGMGMDPNQEVESDQQEGGEGEGGQQQQQQMQRGMMGMMGMFGGYRGPRPTNEIQNIWLVCRGVNLSHVRPTANNQLIFALEKNMKGATNLFDGKETYLTNQLQVLDTNTFRFEMWITLKEPIIL